MRTRPPAVSSIDPPALINHDEEPWTVFLVYGNFCVPPVERNLNFVVVRMPNGRVPWTKQIVPAIDRLVRPWYPPRLPAAKRRWTVDGEGAVFVGDKRLWDSRKFRRFAWDANASVLVEVSNA